MQLGICLFGSTQEIQFVADFSHALQTDEALTTFIVSSLIQCPGLGL